MTDPTRRHADILDEAIAAVRDDVPSAEATEAAGARVWRRIAAAAAEPPRVVSIRGCADIQALFPAYRARGLSAQRALLVEDHLRECAACRVAVQAPAAHHVAVRPWHRGETTVPVRADARRLALAAALVAGLGLAGWTVQRAYFGVPDGPRAAVQAVSGGLQMVKGERVAVLAPGDRLGEAEVIRTAAGSRAVLRLADDSLVEMGERAELAVAMRGRDTTLRLGRGTIIVQAARRGAGRLLVATGDSTVAVTGTVFSVNRGIKGARVSVFEGEVRVRQGGEEKVLAPGDQVSTTPAMGPVPLREEIAWSADADRHLALLAEVKALQRKLASMAVPGLRYESRLLAALPEETVVFASLPNYGEALAEAHRLFEDHIQESPYLRDWWTSVDPARHGGPALAEVVARVRDFSSYLGDEIALVALYARDGKGRGDAGAPILLAEVRREGLREFLEGQLREMTAREKDAPRVRILDGSAPAGLAKDTDVVVLLRDGLIAVSPGDGRSLRALEASLSGGGPRLAATPFGARIAEAYDGGAGLLFAADLERMTDGATADDAPGGRSDARQVLHAAGIDTLRHLVFERKQAGGRAHTQATLGIRGEPRGIPSWLGAPAPMGALDFVSANAQVAAAFVHKAPSLVLDDIVAIASRGGGDAARALAELESELELRVREDVVDALGGEFALALDGPLFPTPSWKLVLEVYDPVRLQSSIAVLVRRAGEEAARAGRPALRLEAEQVGGETYHVVRGGVIDWHYAFADGYLVVAPSRALVMRAIATRTAGDGLGRSADFRALFAPDGDAHVSALLYQNVTPLLGSLLEGPAGQALTPEQREAMGALTADSGASVVCAYAEEGGIRVAGLGGLFELDLTSLALPMLFERAMPGTGRAAAGTARPAGP